MKKKISNLFRRTSHIYYKTREFRPWFVVTSFVFGLLLAIVLIGFTVNHFSSQGCSNRWSGLNTEYTMTGGCVVEWEGQMLPESRIQVNTVQVR